MPAESTRSISLQHWCAYVLGMVFFLYAFIQRVAPSVMTDELMHDFRVGATRLGILSGTYFATYALLQMPIGLLIDRYGARRLLSAAAALACLASIGFAASDSLTMATFYRAMTGATVAFAFVGTLSILSLNFPPRLFNTLAGVLQTMGMAGALVGQAPLRWLIEQRGWQQVFRDLGWMAALLALALFFAVPRRKKNNQSSGTEQDSGASQVETSQQQKNGSADKPSLTASLGQVVSNPQSWYCALFGFGMAAPMLAFAGLWAIPWARSTYGIPPTQAAGIVSLLFLGWGIAAPIAGWFADASGKRKLIEVAGALLALIALSLLIYIPGWSLRSMSILFFLTGCGGSTMILLFSSIRRVNSDKNSAAAMGFANMFVVGAGGILQAVIGWLLDRNDVQLSAGIPEYTAAHFQSALLILIGTSVLALISALLIRESYPQAHTA